MDIRSPNAQVIKQAYTQGRMYALEGTAVDSDTNQIYARTSQDRFVRIDQASEQISILSPDRRTFVMARSLRPGEAILSGPNVPAMTYDVLLPPLTTWQQANVWAPWLATAVGSFGLGYAARAALHSHAPDAHHDAPDAHAIAQGWQEHPIEAPNHCTLDGTPDATLRAMLPGHCVTDSGSHVQMLAGDFDDMGDYQMDSHNEVPMGGYDAVDPNKYHTMVYDGSGTQWEDMSIAERTFFCAVTGVGMTGGALALAGCTTVFVAQPIAERMRARAARRTYEQFQARQQAAANTRVA